LRLSSALNHLKLGKSPGLHSIFPEFLFHAGAVVDNMKQRLFTAVSKRTQASTVATSQDM